MLYLVLNFIFQFSLVVNERRLVKEN